MDQSFYVIEPWLTHKNRCLRANTAYIFGRLGDPRGFDVIAAILAESMTLTFACRPLTHSPRSRSLNHYDRTTHCHPTESAIHVA
jgi:hypothetical protein